VCDLLIGYRIVLSFLLIYVIPMSALVALNGCILAALWRASQGPVARSEPSRATTGGGGGGLPQGRDDPIAEAPGSSGHVCSRHQLSNCSRCGDDLIVVVQSDARQTRLVGCKPVVNK